LRHAKNVSTVEKVSLVFPLFSNVDPGCSDGRQKGRFFYFLSQKLWPSLHNLLLSKNYYAAGGFHRFGHAKFDYGGSNLGSWQFTLLPQLSKKSSQNKLKNNHLASLIWIHDFGYVGTHTHMWAAIPGWEFTKLSRQICKIFLNFKVLLQSGYSWNIGTLLFKQ